MPGHWVAMVTSNDLFAIIGGGGDFEVDRLLTHAIMRLLKYKYQKNFGRLPQNHSLVVLRVLFLQKFQLGKCYLN